jgi:hypothetical protein
MTGLQRDLRVEAGSVTAWSTDMDTQSAAILGTGECPSRRMTHGQASPNAIRNMSPRNDMNNI